ncbi:MAG: VWD domain-containing protein [Nostoc sp.]
MRRFRFLVIGFVSFITVTVTTIFVPGSFLNRVLLIGSCTIFSFNSAFCTQNPKLDTDHAMATSTSTIEKVQDVSRDLRQQETLKVEEQRDFIVAFESLGKEGHGEITENALTTSWTPKEDSEVFLKDKDGTLLMFQDDAIREIALADRSVDIKPDYLDDSSLFDKLENTVFDVFDENSHVFFSDMFYESGYHFDRETFLEGSRWLKFRKADIVKELTPIKDANDEDAQITGKQARKYLGQALHTLQDFYAHTNWVELGFDEIDTRLGREEIPDPPGRISINPKTGEKVVNLSRRDTSEPVDQKEIDEAANFIKLVNTASDLTKVIPTNSAYAKILKIIIKVGKKVLSGHTPEELATAISTKPGILKPEFTTPAKDKRLLTSGYFMGLDPISECSVPKGKTRHGGPSFLSIKISGEKYGLCPNGLNKDDDSRGEGYVKASSLAKKATKDYIRQIIFEDPTISNNIEAIKALMGMKNPPTKDPCKSEKNQNSEQCKQKEGRSNNDPHLATFDGLRYDLQTLGEFILTKSNDRTFEVQARHAPFSSLMSINSAVAVKTGSDRVALYTKDFPDDNTSNPLRVNGKPVTIEGDKLRLKGGGEILKQGNNYVISSPRGEKVLVSPSSFGNNAFFNISPFVYNRSGKYSGLLGNVNGNPNDDLQIRGGGNISEIRSTYGDVNKVLNQVGLRLPGELDKAEKVYFDRLYKDFGDSWRVKQEESLFDYPTGKTTENYSDRSFPDKYLTLNMLSPEQIQKAHNACTEARVTEDLMEGCIFDVGFSGFSEFARTTAEINGYVNIVNQLFPGLKIPTTTQFVDQTIQKIKPKVCFLGHCL